MSTTSSELRANYQPGFDLTHVSTRILKAVSLWSSRARQRRQLLHLTARQLADIGVSAEAAAVEARKPFWQK